MKFFIKNFFNKCGQIRRFLLIWSHLLNKLLKPYFFKPFILMLHSLHSDVVDPEQIIALVVVPVISSFSLLSFSPAFFCVPYCFAGPCCLLSWFFQWCGYWDAIVAFLLFCFGLIFFSLSSLFTVFYTIFPFCSRRWTLIALTSKYSKHYSQYSQQYFFSRWKIAMLGIVNLE